MSLAGSDGLRPPCTFLSNASGLRPSTFRIRANSSGIKLLVVMPQQGVFALGKCGIEPRLRLSRAVALPDELTCFSLKVRPAVGPQALGLWNATPSTTFTRRLLICTSRSRLEVGTSIRSRSCCSAPSPAKLGPLIYLLPHSHDGLQTGAGCAGSSSPGSTPFRDAVLSTTLLTRPHLSLRRPGDR